MFFSATTRAFVVYRPWRIHRVTYARIKRITILLFIRIEDWRNLITLSVTKNTKKIITVKLNLKKNQNTLSTKDKNLVFRFFVANRRNKLTSRHSIMFFSRISMRQKYAVVLEKSFKLGCPLNFENVLIIYIFKHIFTITILNVSIPSFAAIFYPLLVKSDDRHLMKFVLSPCCFLKHYDDMWFFSSAYAVWYRNVFHTRLKTLAWHTYHTKYFADFSRFSEESEFIFHMVMIQYTSNVIKKKKNDVTTNKKKIVHKL